tara:strand:+ start:478 stop:615 length:138 start_codon:yes stop_codon:yes gene_type:complete
VLKFPLLNCFNKYYLKAGITLLLRKNDYTCNEIAIFAIANRKGYQ